MTETDFPGPDDVRVAARLSCETLLPLVDRDWAAPACELEWSARETLEHAAGTQLFYAVHLANRASDRLVVPRTLEPSLSIEDLLSILESRAVVLAEVVKAAPPEARGFHRSGAADPAGFAAMGSSEVLIHTDDIARGFGASFSPPEGLCRRIINRLFPWSPADVDAWSALRWANGRIALPEHERLGPDWPWHSTPLSEWDGTMPTR